MPTRVNWRFRQPCNAMFYDGLPSKFRLRRRRSATRLPRRAPRGINPGVDAIGGDRGVKLFRASSSR
jgi:hypothetical protein